MSNLIHLVSSSCPGIEFHAQRDSFNTKRALRYLLVTLQDFGYQYCIQHCHGHCGKMASLHPNAKNMFLYKSELNYHGCFRTAHKAIGQLPDDIYRHLVQLAEGNCPVCAVLTALYQFSDIAKCSDSPLFTQNSQPCFWGRETDETGWNSDVLIRHVDALHSLSIDELPSRLTPADEFKIRANMKPGKDIIDFIHSFLSANASVSSNIIAQNTTIIDTQSIAKSDAKATGIGIGTGGNAAVTLEREAVKPVANAKIESGAVKLEANPTINVAAPDMKPFADLFAPLVAKLSESETRTVQESKDKTVSDDTKKSDIPDFGGTVGGTENADRLSGYYPSSELAARYGKDPSNVKKKLERFRKKNLSGWVQVTDRGPNDPEFLFQEDAVRSLLEDN